MPDLPPNPELAGDLTGTPSTFSLPRCGSCTHWEPDQDWQDERWGGCTRLSDSGRDDTAGVYIDYIDNSGHHGCGVGFTCPASFGCTEWTPRGDETP